MRSPLRRLACALLAIAGCHPPTPSAPPVITNVADPAGHAVWVYRELSTGLALRSSRVTTYRLTLDSARATLTVTAAETTAGHDLATPGLTGWQDRPPRTFAGRAVGDGPRLALELHEDGAAVTWRWECAVEPVAVAPADAVRVPTVEALECGDEGAWSRPTAVSPALICTAVAGEGDHVSGALAFGAAPGLESLYVNDDCFQGGGLRLIAADGAIANIR